MTEAPACPICGHLQQPVFRDEPIVGGGVERRLLGFECRHPHDRMDKLARPSGAWMDKLRRGEQ